MDSNENILKAVDIHRYFQTPEKTLKVLRGVSLSIPRGKMTAVTGVSGVGKSTLLHLLGGLDRPTSGEVRINDVLLNDKSEEDLANFRNKHVGFVFQFHYLLEDFSAMENIMIPMLVAGKSQNDSRKKAELLLELVGLSDRKSHRPNQLSGGEQQRVAVARALANDPQIVLADEPSGNLDTATGLMLHDLLFRLSRDFTTTFLVATHNRQLADGCYKKYEICDGKICQEN
jgi:predicted ABC-type transport system involved in lysophospholipase L1 biosynthesis ATPase subunit